MIQQRFGHVKTFLRAMFEVFLGGTGKRRIRSISHEAGCPAYEIKGLRPSFLRRKVARAAAAAHKIVDMVLGFRPDYAPGAEPTHPALYIKGLLAKLRIRGKRTVGFRWSAHDRQKSDGFMARVPSAA